MADTGVLFIFEFYIRHNHQLSNSLVGIGTNTKPTPPSDDMAWPCDTVSPKEYNVLAPIDSVHNTSRLN